MLPWPRFLAVLVLCLALAARASAATLTGTWSLALDPDFSDHPATLQCAVTQDGRSFTLDCGDAGVFDGTVDGHAVKFVIMTGENGLLPARFSGELDSNETVIHGTWRLEDTTGNRIGRFTAAKQ